MKTNSLFDQIQRPTLLLDEFKCRRNIERMVDSCKKQNVIFRPHFKTHQSLIIGNWFREIGIDQITVSSLGMAKYFADAGWSDMTLAFPLNLREMDLVNEIAAASRLHVLCQSVTVAQELVQKIKSELNVWIKIDVGTHRTGLSMNEIDEIKQICLLINQNSKTRLIGLLAHAGHSYAGGSDIRMQKLHDETVVQLNAIRDALNDDFPNLKLSVGDTPIYSRIEAFSDVDEIRSGNLVFYDMTQVEIGSCAVEDIAVAMACPVVAKHADRTEVILYGGGIHFSKDRYLKGDGKTSFGQLAFMKGNSWVVGHENSYLRSLSQEHGVLKCAPEDFDRLSIGDLALILPVHSCMCANLMGGYLGLSGTRYDHFSSSETRFQLT